VRPSCSRPSEGGTSIAAVAVLAGAAFADAKIGPAVARIWHLAVEALMIATITAAAAVAIVATCATVSLVGKRRHARQQMLQTVPSGTRHPVDNADNEPGCLACGDTGTVLRAITGGRYQQQPCPECQPAQRTG
jgi:hypothetical protein